MTTTKKVRRVHCAQCQLLRINGLVCHEIGCPEAWRGRGVECKWCGGDFDLRRKGQRCCSPSCERSYQN